MAIQYLGKFSQIQSKEPISKNASHSSRPSTYSSFDGVLLSFSFQKMEPRKHGLWNICLWIIATHQDSSHSAQLVKNGFFSISSHNFAAAAPLAKPQATTFNLAAIKYSAFCNMPRARYLVWTPLLLISMLLKTISKP